MPHNFPPVRARAAVLQAVQVEELQIVPAVAAWRVVPVPARQTGLVPVMWIISSVSGAAREAPAESVVPVAPADPGALVAPAESVVLVAPADPGALVAPAESVVLVAPADPAALVALAESVVPVALVAPAALAESVVPVALAESAALVAPVESVVLAESAALVALVESVVPVAPVESAVSEPLRVSEPSAALVLPEAWEDSVIAVLLVSVRRTAPTGASAPRIATRTGTSAWTTATKA